VRPGRALLLGMVGLIISLGIGYWQQSASPVLAAVLTVAAGAIPLIIDYIKEVTEKAPVSQNRHDTGAWSPGAPDRRRRPGVGSLVAALVMIVVIGGGIAYGATYAFGLITGNEPAVQRLEEPVSGAAGALDVRIDEVGVGDHYTHVRLTATNGADFPVTIPLFSNCQLIEKGQPALEAKTGFTTSVIDVPPAEIPVTKEIVFSGRPSDGATLLTLACSTLYWQGFGQPQSLQVKGIALEASG
jgi:hypothetical protein